MATLKSFLLAFCFLSAIPALAQDLPYARQVVDTLASEYMFGRGYVKDGHLKAAHYIANEYDRWGLQKFGESYFQKFTIDVNTFPDDVEIELNDEDKYLLKTGQDFIVHPCSPFLEDELVPVHLKVKDLLNQNRLNRMIRKEDALHVAFMVERPEKEELSKKEWEQYNQSMEVLRFVQDMEAGAIIELTGEKLTWHMSRINCARPFIQIKKEAVPEEGITSLDIDIDAELAEDIETQNVVGYIPGTKYPDSFVVFSAHYDHLGGMGDKVFIPGANDDASGVAMMLTLAKHYSQPANRPEFSIVFMAFGAEEVGIIGSKYFIDFPLFPIPSIKFMLNMDMVGTGSEGIMVVNGRVFTGAYETLVEINNANDYLVKIKSRGEAANSDHWFFYKAGVPSFFIYTMGGIGAYHDVFDRAETLPLTEYEDLFRLLTQFVEQL